MVKDSPVLHRDDTWLVVDKPTGLSTHGAHAGDLGAAEWLTLHLGEVVHVCSRLDKGTSGVLPLARTPAASAEAERVHAAGTAAKTYHLLTDRHPPAPTWTVRSPLDGEPAETRFAVEESRQGRHRVRAEITRGRRHQIRRHAAESGVPLLGDTEYRGTAFPRLCLHCAEVRWPGQSSPWASPLPSSFAGWLAGESPLVLAGHAALERRGAWLCPTTDAFRLVHRGELGGLPVAVDRYGEWLLVTGFDERTSGQEWLKTLHPVLERIQERYGWRGGMVRSHRRDPHHRSLIADANIFGDPPPDPFWVREGELFFEVSLNESQHTGLFLDQRDNRRRLAAGCAGKRVANLFAFTCSFSAAAVAAGAEVAFSLDLAAGSLERGKRTFARNGLDAGGRGKFVREDVRDWLARQLRKKERDGDAWRGWDRVICDPPVFASAGGGKAFSVEKEWEPLARAVRDVMPPDGRAWFSNNHRGGDDPRYRETLARCFAEVQPITPPLDFPPLPGEPGHVRMYTCAV